MTNVNMFVHAGAHADMKMGLRNNFVCIWVSSHKGLKYQGVWRKTANIKLKQTK